MDNGATENFYGRFKAEMFYGKNFKALTLSLMNLRNTFVTATMIEFLSN